MPRNRPGRNPTPAAGHGCNAGLFFSGNPRMRESENGVGRAQHVEQRVLRAACSLYEGSPAPNWVTFFRQVLGLHGIVRRTYRTAEAMAAFERSEAYAEILQMLTRLREQSIAQDDGHEPTKVITVRLPQSLHETLRAEAHEHQTSMNKLCISKLLQLIDTELIPKERWRQPDEPALESQSEMPTETTE
jgi:predicted HicB family RNase H-like nuclease